MTERSLRVVAEAGVEVPEEQLGRLDAPAGNRNPYDVARDVADFIVKKNDPPELFRMGPAVVQLREDGTVASLDQDGGAGWLAYVAARVNFTVQVKDGTRLIAPPAAAMKIIPAIVVPELPQLDGVVNTPYMDGDGNVVASDGYHPGTQLVLRTRGMALPAVPATPTAQEVADAAALLTDDWLRDFPWAKPADMVNAIAGLLTVTGRPFFSLSPLFVVDASTPGSGKGLLVTTLLAIVTGESPEFMELPANGDEQRKKITAAMLAGKTVITWDERTSSRGEAWPWP